MTTQRLQILTGIVMLVCVISSIQGIARIVSAYRLPGTTWALQYYGDHQDLQAVLPRPRWSTPTLAFGRGTMTGWGGCNAMHGSFHAVGSALKLSFGTTFANCGSTTETHRGEILGQEAHYLGLLYEVDTFTRDGNTLTLHTPDAILVFARSN